ncbi:MAG: DUF6340 family protein [Elusimicrobia bacterium]|nr:DUF6340 family protein [Elusimicrobiota bacterium]
MRKKIISYFLFFTLPILIVGCGTGKINIKYLKPAETNYLAGIKRISVLDFEGKKSEVVTGLFVKKLLDNKSYEIIEKEQPSKTTKEQKIDLSDSEEIIKLGKQLKVDMFISGNVIDYSFNDVGGAKEEEYEDKKTKTKVKKNYYVVQREAKVDIILKIVSAETGKVLHTISKSEKIVSEPERVEYKPEKLKEYFSLESIAEKAINKDFRSSEEKAKDEATSNLPDSEKMLLLAANKVLDYLIQQIAPYYVSELRYVENSGHKKMKQSYDLVKRGMWEDAKNIWMEILNDPSLKKIYPKVYNNLGVYYEVTGELDNAENEFMIAYKLSGKDVYLDAKATVQQMKKDQEKLKSQKTK